MLPVLSLFVILLDLHSNGALSLLANGVSSTALTYPRLRTCFSVYEVHGWYISLSKDERDLPAG